MTLSDLTTQRDETLARLDRRWAWCDANPGHPLFAEREDAVLADLAEYERLEDALRAHQPTQSAFMAAATRADRFTS